MDVMSVTATANQPTASSGSITFSWSTTNATSWTVSLQYSTTVGGTFTTLSSTTTTGTATGSQNGIYTTPTTSYYYQTTVTAQGPSGPVTSTSTALYYYNPYQGPQGVQGYQGVQGIQGWTGPTGIQGPQGPAGGGGAGSTFVGGPITSDLYVSSGTPSLGRAGAPFINMYYSGIISNTIDTTINRIGGVTLGANGYASGVDFTATSDVRTKTDISTITSALDKVKALRGVYFTRNGETSRSIGVIAQEVEAVLPEVVHTGSDDMKSVSYGNMVGLLIEAIKELSLSTK